MVNAGSFDSKWARASTGIDGITDALGMPIEKGIRDTVIALRLLGFPTSGSCEGHVGRGCSSPWVDVLAASPALYRWKGQEAAETRILQELGIPKAQISPGKGFNPEAWKRLKHEEGAWLKTQGHVESTTFTAFIRRCAKIHLELSSVVEGFNRAKAKPNRRLVLDFMKSSGHTRISVMDEWSAGDDALNRGNGPKAGLRDRQKRLLARQEMMKGFTQHLMMLAGKS